MKVNNLTSLIPRGLGLGFILFFYSIISTYAIELAKQQQHQQLQHQQQLQQLQQEVQQEIQEQEQYKNNTVEKILSRKRRFIAFPYGSSFSATICTTIGMYGNPNVNWISYALNMGISYNLPNETWVIDSAHGFGNLNDDESSTSGAVMLSKRRSRRDLYRGIETIIDAIGFNGKQCILRTLCEVAKLFMNRKGTMVEEIVKTVFTYPGRKVFSKRELNDNIFYEDYMYQKAYQRGRKVEYVEYCSYYFSNCTFSLVDLALGKYSVRPTRLMQNSYDSIFDGM